jgi:hypothetical protein
MIMNIIQRIFRIIYYPGYEYSRDAVSIFKLILSSTYLSTYIGATNMIIGFWFSLLVAKLRPVLATRMQIISIFFTVLVLVCCPVGTTLTQLGYSFLFLALLFIPFIADAIYFVTIAVRIGCSMKVQLLKDSTLKRKVIYASRIFNIIACLWVYYAFIYLVVIIMIPIAFPQYNAVIKVVFGLINDVVEFIIAICMLLLIDRKDRRKTLTCYGCGKYDPLQTNSNSNHAVTSSKASTKTSTTLSSPRSTVNDSGASSSDDKL